MLKKIKNKLKEENGVDGSVEMGLNILILIIVLIAIIGFIHLLYTNFQVTQFANETIRIVELCGEVGGQAEENIEKLKNTMGINPKVTFDKTGKLSFLENVNVTVELPYSLKIPFLDIKMKIIKKATGMSEVYWKN